MDANTVTALPALIMAGLVAYAFGPRFYRAFVGPARPLARGICVFAIFAAARLWFWDVLQYVAPDLLPFDTRSGPVAPWVNAVCNLGWCAACYLILTAIHMQIPAPDRARWWVILSPFYPKRLRILAWRDPR